MTYNPAIPQPTDILSQSQGQMLINFNQANVIFGNNHVPFSPAVPTNGMHKKVEFPANLASPALGSAISVLYPRLGTDGNSQLWFKNASIDYQLTGSVSNAASGYVYLPGGVLLQWGSIQNGAGIPSAGAINYPIAFSATPYSVTLGQGRATDSSDRQIYIKTDATFNASQFNYRTSGSNNFTALFWQAIGPG